jgi:hypothetical protein
MKTIFMVCRSEKETPLALIQLMKTLFPECEVHVIYRSSAPPEMNPASPAPHQMEGL